MTASKIVAAAASGAGSSALDISDVFSTHLWEGDGTTRNITNNIDLSGQGGMVWIKSRDATHAHNIYDTARGVTKYLDSASNAAEATASNGLTQFNNNGFTVGNGNLVNGGAGDAYIGWTFRKQEKFFDIVTYTGDSQQGRQIAHNLGSVPGMIAIKITSGGTDHWTIYHRGTDSSQPEDYRTRWNQTAERLDVIVFDDTAPTSTHFTVSGYSEVNSTGKTYVAYLFAHNNNDGIFGPDEDQDIIKCGSYTGDAASQQINIGFEPQWVMIKNTSRASTNWSIFDTMRFWQNPGGSGDSKHIVPNSSAAETGIARFYPTATGFGFTTENGTHMNYSSDNYIYVAIRKGSLFVPQNASDVFGVASATGASGELAKFRSTFRVDLALDRESRDGTGYFRSSSRLTGTKRLTPTANDNESNQSAYEFDYMTGWNSASGTDGNHFAWMWQRAPKFCDVVAYKGTGNATTFNHNLGVAPEMMWIKRRNTADSWAVYHKDLTAGHILNLNNTGASQSATHIIPASPQPTSTTFAVGGGDGQSNNSGDYYVNYMFATLAGVSKVGSITATGNTINVDCGFSNGAKFILMKRADSTTFGWVVWDSVRGIVAGNDPYLLINDTAAEVTNTDYVDPLSSGFTLTDSFYSAGTWIFYAVAA